MTHVNIPQTAVLPRHDQQQQGVSEVANDPCTLYLRRRRRQLTVACCGVLGAILMVVVGALGPGSEEICVDSYKTNGATGTQTSDNGGDGWGFSASTGGDGWRFSFTSATTAERNKVLTRTCAERPTRCTDPEKPCWCHELMIPDASNNVSQQADDYFYCDEKDYEEFGWGTKILGIGILALCASCGCSCLGATILFCFDWGDFRRHRKHQRQQQQHQQEYPTFELNQYPHNKPPLQTDAVPVEVPVIELQPVDVASSLPADQEQALPVAYAELKLER